MTKFTSTEHSVTPHGSEIFNLINPSVNRVIGHVTLGDEVDIRRSLPRQQAAFAPLFEVNCRRAYRTFGNASTMLFSKRVPELQEATIREYGATVQRAAWSNQSSRQKFFPAIYWRYQKVIPSNGQWENLQCAMSPWELPLQSLPPGIRTPVPSVSKTSCGH